MSEKQPKWQVGQQIILMPSANERREPIETTITRVGRKYVYAMQYGHEIKFDEWGQEVSDYPGSARSIRTPLQHARIQRQEKANARLSELGLSHTGYGRWPWSVEKLEAVIAVLEGPDV